MSSQGPDDKTACIEAVIGRYERPLMRYAARITGDLERARDIVQDTFLRFLSAGGPREDDRLGPWLFAVCRNRALDVLRKERRMSRLSEAQSDAQASGEPGPPVIAERREVLGSVMAALAELSEGQQEVIRLKFQNGFSYRQIAEITGLSVGNVGFLIHTALNAIRRKLRASPGSTGAG
ncbi:MAG: hypothetical protein B1H04_03040 [Planctomycetales bacterium 4484_123]|nr:MAG: hypothetical protein B1H04_03040 [Planctomycetales bacterium 4484_123]